MSEPVELRFKIRAYSPATMPMERLARYLENLATILGQTSSVHLLALEGSSTVPVVRVDWEAYPKVKKRLRDVRNREGPDRALKAVDAITKDLADDNATSGDLLDPQGGRLLHFPGASRVVEPEYGPFSQHGSLDGVPILVGGQRDPVPVHLEAVDGVHHCSAKREVARKIGRHLFETPLRVSGTGRWSRDEHGVWWMRSFRIETFEEIPSLSLIAATEQLRSITATWKNLDDPLGDLVGLRHLERSR